MGQKLNFARLRSYRAGPVKALGEGRIYGPVVLFGDAKNTDLARDFFTKTTDYGLAERLPVHYQHGFDQVIRKRRLSVARFGLGTQKGLGDQKVDDDDLFGLWAEYQLDLSDKYQAHLYQMAEEGKMAHSSGAVGHLVERKALPNETFEITAWPLAELSLTPEPAEPRMLGRVVPAKAYIDTKSIFSDDDGAFNIGAANINLTLTVDHKTNGGHTMPEPVTQGTPDPQGPSPAPDVVAILTEMQSDIAALKAVQTPAPPAPAPTPQPDPVVAVPDTPAPPDYKAIVSEILAEQQKAFEPQREVWTPTAPAYVKHLGDSFTRAFQYWVKTGDNNPLRHLEASNDGDNGPWDMKNAFAGQFSLALKASNATVMLAGTDAAGGAAVPQGHVDTIVARRDEMSLWRKLGVRQVPGRGLTVHLPIDNEDDGEFVSTAERAENDDDSPATDTKAFTLVNYTKRVPITTDLLDFETSGLLTFIEDFVSRGAAKTENNLLLTETAASGTSLVTFASSVAIAFGEPESVIANDDLGDYLDDTSSNAWVTRRSTYYNKIIQVTDANNRMYAETQAQSSSAGPTLLGYPVNFSQKVTAFGAQANPSAKAIHFGNWFYVGVRHDPEMRILRDEFSEAKYGIVNLHYFFRTVYKVIQAEAMGYGVGAAT